LPVNHSSLISARIADTSHKQEAGLGKIETTRIDIGLTVSHLDLENQTDSDCAAKIVLMRLSSLLPGFTSETQLNYSSKQGTFCS
jgi:hypothetical protein